MSADRAGHIDEFDHLRALAILLTLLAHAAFMQPEPWHLYLYVVQNVAQFWGGVHLFFVISGYVITRGYVDKFSAQQAPNGADFRLAWKRFYVQRFFRIVPTSLAWILAVIVLTISYNVFGSFGTVPSILVQALAASFFVYNAFVPWIAGTLAVYWSLALEGQFYLLFPLLSRLPRRWLGGAMAAIVVVLFFVARPADQTNIMVSFPVDALAWGVLIALGQKSKWTDRFEPIFLKSSRARLANFVLSIAVIVVAPTAMRNIFFGTAVLEVAAAWLVFCASLNKGYVNPYRPLQPVTKLMGKVSYSLYLCHLPAYLVARETLQHLTGGAKVDTWEMHVAALVIASIVAAVFVTVSYRFIEQPTRTWGRRLADNIGKRS